MHVSFYEHNICINSSLNNKKRHEICRIAGVKKKAFFPHCIVNYTSLENAKHKMRQRCNFAENPTLSIPNVIICSFRTWLILILFFFYFCLEDSQGHVPKSKSPLFILLQATLLITIWHRHKLWLAPYFYFKQ